MKVEDYLKIVKADVEKGSCYANCIWFMQRNEGWKLVHAVAIGTGPENLNKEFGHAWVEKFDEKTGIVWGYDPSSDILAPAAIFKMVGKVRYCVEYSWAEATDKMIATGTYGPWDKVVSMALHEENPPRTKRKRPSRSAKTEPAISIQL